MGDEEHPTALDDRSHDLPRRRERDRFKEEVLASAGVPVYRVAAREAYAAEELGEVIERYISEGR